MNVDKTKIVVVDPAGNLSDSNILQEFEKIYRFVYLESVVRKDGRSTAKIRRRIILSKEA